MRKTKCIPNITWMLAIVSLTANYIQAAPVANQQPPEAGIWGIWDLESDMDPNNPLYDGDWLKGSMVSVDWHDIQPGKNNYNWGPLKNKLNKAEANLQQVILMVYQGEKTPEWIYDDANGGCPGSLDRTKSNDPPDGCVPAAGQPKKNTDKNNNGIQDYRYPDYLDPDFKIFFSAMIKKVADFIYFDQNGRYRDLVTIVQCPIGKSGDGNPYMPNGSMTWYAPYNKNYLGVKNSYWQQWELDICRVFYNEYFKANKPQQKIKLLFKPAKSQTFTSETPFKNNKSKIMMKSTFITHGYQLTNEKGSLGGNESKIKNFLVRGECAEPLKHLLGKGFNYKYDNINFWNDNPRQNLYWQCLWMLHLGMDVFNIRNVERFEQGTDNKYSVKYWQEAQEIFKFYTKRAGIKNAKKDSPFPQASDQPWKSKYAFIALREGLSYESKDYVSYSGSPPDLGTNAAKNRFNAIKNTVNNLLGANGNVKLDDLDKANKDQGPLAYLGYLGSSELKGINDINSNIYEGNYTLYITQKNAKATSQGYWNIGPVEGLNTPASVRSRCGRFAKGFKGGSNRMSFDLDDRFFGSTANTNPKQGYVVEIHVTYLDKGTNKFKLFYDSDSGEKQAYVHTTGNTNTWKTRVFSTTNARFKNLASGADIILEKVSGNPIFHMIEVVKVDDGVGSGPPQIDPIANITVNEAGSKTRNVTANAPGGNSGLTLTASGLPGWASFTDNGNGNGSFDFSPLYWVVKHPDTNKAWNITVTVDDGNGGTDSEAFVLTVNDVNRAPSFTSTNSDSTIDEGGSASINLTANDLDAEDSIIFSASGLPGFATLVDNGDDTAVINLAPGFDDAGIYNISVDISDGFGGSASDSIQITVIDVPQGGGETIFEMEDATFVESSGDTLEGLTKSGASGSGSPNLMHYKSNEIGDYIQYEIDIPTGGGNFDFHVGVQHGPPMGIIELKVNANGVIGTQDLHRSTWNFGEVYMGSFNFSSGGTRTLTFTVTGQTPAANGVKMRLDYVKITEL